MSDLTLRFRLGWNELARRGVMFEQMGVRARPVGLDEDWLCGEMDVTNSLLSGYSFVTLVLVKSPRCVRAATASVAGDRCKIGVMVVTGRRDVTVLLFTLLALYAEG